MKHAEIKAFVRKYNSEFAIKGYSKMKKQPLTDEVKRVISKSRAEIQKEWRELSKVEPKKANGDHGREGYQKGGNDCLLSHRDPRRPRIETIETQVPPPRLFHRSEVSWKVQ